MIPSAVVCRVHPWQTRLVHAVAGGLVIYGLVFNGEDKPIVTDAAFLTRELIAAALILIATVVRVMVVRRAGWQSALSDEAPAWEHVASRLVHRATYVLLGGTLVTGFAIGVFAPAALNVPIWRLVAARDVELDDSAGLCQRRHRPQQVRELRCEGYLIQRTGDARPPRQRQG